MNLLEPLRKGCERLHSVFCAVTVEHQVEDSLLQYLDASVQFTFSFGDAVLSEDLRQRNWIELVLCLLQLFFGVLFAVVFFDWM